VQQEEAEIMGSPTSSHSNSKRNLIAALCAAFRRLPPEVLAGMVAYLSNFQDIPARKRAVHIKLLNPGFSDSLVAKMVGVHRSTLSTWPEYRRLKAALKILPTLPDGTVDDNGFIEAYLSDAS
jgi:hypothetical protein